MGKARPAMLSLNGGMVDHETIARSDLENYANKHEVFQNVLPAVKGGAKKAPGTRFIGYTYLNRFAVLRKWVYSRSQVFVQELTAERIRLIQDDDTPGFVMTGTATATIGAWADGSSGGASIGTSSPTWTRDPWDDDFGSTSNPLTLTVPDGATGRATATCTTASSSAQHSLALCVSRNWVDLRIGTTSGGGEILESEYGKDVIRLDPGYYVFTFAPGAATFYVDVRADRGGKRGLRSMTFLTANQELSLPTPYAEGDLRSLRFDQLGDQRWIVGGYAPRILERQANDSWGVRAFRPENGPFLSANTNDAHTLTPSAVSGEITLTSSKALFRSTHIGALFQLTHIGQYEARAVTAEDQWSDPIRVSGVSSGRTFYYGIGGTFVGTWTLQRAVGNTVDWTDVTSGTGVTSTSLSDGYDNSIIYYRIGVAAGDYTSGTLNVSLTFAAGETVGVCRIVEVASATSATADVIEAFGKAEATTDWAEGAWSDFRGWPAATAFHQGRLWFGRGTYRWASASDNFWSFDLDVGNDDDAISRQAASGDSSPLVWMASALRLLSGAESNEAETRSTSFDEPITPTNMNLRETSSRGAANVQAVKHDNRVMFVTASGQRLIRLSYDVDMSGYKPFDLTRLNEYIAGEGGFVDLDVQREPEPRVWCVCADGRMAVLTFQEDEAVVGWSEIVTNYAATYDSAGDPETETWDSYETVAVAAGKPEDRPYVVTSRTIDGSAVRMIERFEKERWHARSRATTTEREQAWRVHAGITYSGAATTTISGLDHLEGEAVAVWGDGSDRGEFTVASGAITLPNAVEYAVVGLPYKGRIKTGKLAYGASDGGTGVGLKKRVERVTLLLDHTPWGAIQVGGSFSQMSTLADRDNNFTMDAAPALFTGEVEYGDFGASASGGYKRDPRICFVMGGAGPVAIAGFLPSVQAGER